MNTTRVYLRTDMSQLLSSVIQIFLLLTFNSKATIMTRDVVDHDKEVTYSPLDWIILAVSLGFQVFLLIVVPEFAWVGLPFWMTYLFKCLRQI